jgi:hypothetical protein
VNIKRLLHERSNEIRGRGPDNDQVNIFGPDVGRFNCGFRSFYAKAGCCFFFGRQVAPLNTGTGANPFIGGLDDVLEIRIRQNAFRQVAAGTSDF